jgi:hypothetical protein
MHGAFFKQDAFHAGDGHKLTVMTGARDIPVVRELLARLAAYEAGLSAMVDGQIERCQPANDGFMIFNHRYLYASLN